MANRYVVRFTNGYWRVLDLNTYYEVGMFGLKKEADANARTRNG